MTDAAILLTTKQASEYLGGAWKPQTLAKRRVTGGGPPFVKIGGRVMYRRDDLDAWVEKLTRATTEG